MSRIEAREAELGQRLAAGIEQLPDRLEQIAQLFALKLAGLLGELGLAAPRVGGAGSREAVPQFVVGCATEAG